MEAFAKALATTAAIPDAVKSEHNLWPSMADACTRTGNKARAIQIWKGQAVRNPADPAPHENLFWLLRETGALAAAEEQLAWLIEHQPGELRHIETAVQLASESNLHEKVLAWSERGLKLAPDSRHFLDALAHAAGALEKWELALETRRKLRRLVPGDYSVANDLLGTLLHLKKEPEAIALLEEMWTAFSKDPARALEIGRAWGWCGKPGKELEVLLAMENKGQLAGLAPASEVQARKAALYEQLQDIPAASGAIEALMELKPAQKEVHRRHLLEIAMWTQDLAFKIRQYARLAREPQEILRLAELRLEAQDFATAEADLARVSGPVADSTRAWELRLQFAYRKNDTATILAGIERRLRENLPASRRAGYHLDRAYILQDRGQREEALAAVQSSLALRPGHLPAKRLAAHLNYNAGRYGEAARLFAACEPLAPADRYLLGASLLKQGGASAAEGRRQLSDLMRAGTPEARHDDLLLAINAAEALEDRPGLLRILETLATRHQDREAKLRLARLLFDDGQEQRAETCYRSLAPGPEPDFLALLKAFDPDAARPRMNTEERLAQAYRHLDHGDWAGAMAWLP